MKSLFRKEVVAAQSTRLQGEVSLTQQPTFVWLTLLLLLIVSTAIIFLFSADYQRKETVLGVLQPQQGVSRLLVEQQGIIDKVWVEEGQQVQAGDVLVQLSMPQYGQNDSELHAALQTETLHLIQTLSQQQQQQQQQLTIRQTELTQRIQLLERQSSELDAQLATFKERMQLNEQLVRQIQQLAGSGYISQLELNRQKDAVLALKQQVQSLTAQQLLVQAELSAQQSQLKQLPIEFATQQTDVESQLSHLRQQQARIAQQQTVVYRAPMAGTVSGLRYQVGQALSMGTLVLSIVPHHAPLEAVVYVPTRAIAFIAPGQDAKIRFDAFPYQRFGVHSATVKSVSQSVLLPTEVTELQLTAPSYRVVLTLAEQSVSHQQQALPLRADMTLTADVITAQRSLLYWLFEPILTVQGQF